MKLRMHDDSLRLRLDREEVDALARGEAVATQARLPGGGALRWSLAAGPDYDVALDGGEVRVRAPAAAITHWATDDTEVSLRARLPAAGATLAVLIEKDFECLEPRAGESQSNRFANPKKAATTAD